MFQDTAREGCQPVETTNVCSTHRKQPVIICQRHNVQGRHTFRNIKITVSKLMLKLFASVLQTPANLSLQACESFSVQVVDDVVSWKSIVFLQGAGFRMAYWLTFLLKCLIIDGLRD